MIIQVILQNLKGLGSIAASINRYSFDTDTMCVGMVCNDFEIGFVMAELQDKRKATTHRYVYYCDLIVSISDTIQLVYGA